MTGLRALVALLLIVLSSVASAAPRNIALGPFGMWVDNAGSDANDGLTPATPKQHYCAALRDMEYNWDFHGNQPFLFATSGQTFNEMCFSGGMLVGAVSIIVVAYDPQHPSSPTNILPAPNFIRSCSPPGCGSVNTPAIQWCEAFGDFTIRIYHAVTWRDCNHWNMSGGASIQLHNDAVVDFFEVGTEFHGSGNNDVAVLADGRATISVANGATFFGTFDKGYRCNRTCLATVSGELKFVNANMNGIYGMYSGSRLFLGATYDKDAASVVGRTVISGGSWVTTNGTIVLPGTPANPYGGIATPYSGNICPGGPVQC